MANIYTSLAAILKGMEETLTANGFTAVYPEGVKKPDLPAVTEGGRITIDFRGAKGSLRMEHFDDKIALLFTNKSEADVVESDFGQLSLSLLDAKTADEKDAKYVADDFSESINKQCGTKTKGNSAVRSIAPVSKNAAKSGMASYDANTLGSRFTVMFPELRAEYKANVDRYGEFLAEDFFTNYGTAAVIQTIRQNDKVKMKKMFGLFNEIYEDGTNEIQSLIAVSILGSLDNDQDLLANCVDYMCKDLFGPVIQVNKFLASNGGKGAKMRLENPPPYKPKKAKKKNPITSALGM
ncbi:MAG: hypothetical protein WCN92_07050 [Eubacteriales bacterium]